MPEGIPPPSTQAAAMGGAAAAIIVWVASLYGVFMPAGIETAFGALISTAFAYLFRYTGPRLNNNK